jgi:uncharacterized glyoxalase superfamily protein PhnB
LGFTVADVEAFYRDKGAKGVLFSMPPKKQGFGGVLAQFVDSEGANCSVGAEARSTSRAGGQLGLFRAKQGPRRKAPK